MGIVVFSVEILTDFVLQIVKRVFFFLYVGNRLLRKLHLSLVGSWFLVPPPPPLISAVYE